MVPQRRIPTTLRDFLNYLPALCENEYSTVVSYLVWRTLKNCLNNKYENIDWRSLIEIFESESWQTGKYQSTLHSNNWKKEYFQNNKNLNNHINSMCSRHCYPIETVYYCFSCTTNPLYEICEECFDKEQHIGHTYAAKVVTRLEGRVCHCGNPSVFKEPKYAFLCKNKRNNNARRENKEYDENMHTTFNDIFDFIIEIMFHLREQNDIQYYCADDSSQTKADNVLSQGDISLLSDESSEDGSVKEMIKIQYEYNRNLNEKWGIQIDDADCQMHAMDLASKISKVLNTSTEYAMAITDKLIDNCTSTTIITSDDFSKLRKIAEEFEKQSITVHIRRLKDIFQRELIDDLTDWIYKLCDNSDDYTRLVRTLRLTMLGNWTTKSDTMISSIDSKLKRKNGIKLYGGFLVSNSTSPDVFMFQPWNFNHITDRNITLIMNDYNRELIENTSTSNVSQFCTIHGSRFQFIATECANLLSKTSSFKMLRVLCKLFTLNDESRKCLAAQYFDVYLTILYSTVASDNTGAKVSLMSLLSQYTFQDPEIANLAIRSGFIERALKFAFMLMAFNPEDLLSYLPITLYQGLKLPSEAIRNRRTIICFKDLCMLMSTNTIPEELLQNRNILQCIVDAFSEFSNILPLKRETAEHVEFENFDFSSFYFFFSSVLIMTDGYIRSVALIEDKKKRREFVINLLHIAVTKEFELLGRFRKRNEASSALNPLPASNSEKPHLSTVKENICNHLSDTINFQVGVDAQNFFNPMSYLFKFILQWSQSGRYEPLPDNLKNCIELSEIFSDKKKALYMSESALSTLVLIGQINVGFWVRNGAPITHQLRMYTKYSMREFTYASDLFNVQFSMCMSDPDDFMVTYISRWGLKHWANGIPMGDYPDDETTIGIVNECILLLIQLLTEVKSLALVSSIDGFEKTLRTEIINAICFDTCTYNQIMSIIPEHITKHAAFDTYLNKYTNYTAPTGLNDSGSFTLKPAYRNEIDPYYFGISSSRRYEIEKNMRKHMADEKMVSYDDTFVPAKNVIGHLIATPYHGLYSISSVDTFGMFLKNTLEHIKKFEYENLLPRAVHLIHLCVINNVNDFMKIFWREYAVVDTEFCHYHSIGSVLYSCLLIDNFSNHHGKIREIYHYLSESAPHVDINGYLQEQAFSYNPDLIWSSIQAKSMKDQEIEKKKKTAKSRKNRLLRKLAKQQLKFMENNSVNVSDIETSMESPTPLSHLSSVTPPKIDELAWRFPDDYCVFCKMTKDDDSFVYFSYQEMNICDHQLSFDQSPSLDIENGSLNLTAVAAVKQNAILRTCGHGSHVKCLGDHMKSIRSGQTQTTKNIPSAYGFGLIYCPVCNALGNSFVPKFCEYNDRSVDSFFTPSRFGSSVTLNSVLTITSKEAALIFSDLLNFETVNDTSNYNIANDCNNIPHQINQLLINTVENLEMRLRNKNDDTSMNVRDIPSQCMVTMRLLTEFVTYLHHVSNETSMEENSFTWNISWDRFLLNYSDINPLLLTNELFTMSGGTSEERAGCLLKLIKCKLYQDFVSLLKELISHNFEVTLRSNSSKSDGVALCNNILSVFTDKLFHQDGILTDERLKTFGGQLYCLIKDSMKVFLRRLHILFFVRYPIETINESNNVEELNYYFNYFRLPSILNFDDLLQDFIVNDVELIIHIINNVLSPSDLFQFVNDISRLSFASPEPFHLVDLPYNLSHLHKALKNENVYKALREELTICLFCGQKMNIQKQVSTQGYSIGNCTDHMRNGCPVISTYGVFLLVRTNSIYISYGDRGTFYRTPYLNEYGEADEEFKFSLPVYLNEKRYEFLTKEIVLGNMIPHLIFRSSDGNADLGGWETL